MRPGERDVLLLMLAIASGSADGWSYMGLGHAFVANMTGNTVLLGLAASQGRAYLHPLASLACYAAGTALATLLLRRVREGVLWTRAVSAVLLLEACLMGAAAGSWAVTPSNQVLDVLLACVALAIGLQSGAMLRLKIPGVVTTYITGTWTNVMSGLVKLGAQERKRPRGERIAFEERLFLQCGVLAAYLVSALITGWTFKDAPRLTGLIPTCSVLLVAVYGMARR